MPPASQPSGASSNADPDWQEFPPAEHTSLFFDPDDGALDISGFLSKKVGFLPVAFPITEPAVGVGLGLGLTFFHDYPKVVPRGNGQQSRVIMPSATVLFGATTENGTWATALGHLGVWNNGRIRYQGAVGYGSLNLDWFGKGDRFGGRSIEYNNDVLFLYQRAVFQIGDSDFFIGPQYKLLSTDATFDSSLLDLDVPPAELSSKTAGLGITLSYDSLDHPFSPTKGIRAEATYAQQDEIFGGDFTYGRLDAFGLTYVPLTSQMVLGLRLDGGASFGDAPFYDLPMLQLRGLPMAKYVDDLAVVAEAELRYDVTDRWTLVGFGGTGRIADSLSDFFDAKDHWAGGMGFRYLIAKDYGLRMGVDVAYGDDEATIYITVGTGWIRP